MSADNLKPNTKDSELLIRRIAKCGVKVATVESCTGGLLSAMLTDLPGSSDWFLGGFVTYSNDSKINLVGVEKKIIDEFGAVSQSVAQQMALGAMNKLTADISVSITGIAGPTGGTEDKPVGTVWIGWCTPNEQQSQEYKFHGSRQEIRMSSVYEALRGILSICEK